MPTVKCPHCNTEYDLDKQYFGCELECQVCKQIFTPEEPSAFEDHGEDFPSANAMNDKDCEEDINIRSKLGSFLILSSVAQMIDTVAYFLYAFTPDFIFSYLAILIARLISIPSMKIVEFFEYIQTKDKNYLKELEVLRRYGKQSSSLVAPAQTIFSPGIGLSISNTRDPRETFKFGLFSHRKNFIYSLEEFVKIYTFEDQLFIFKAYWDYTTGKFFSESTDAFFFKDISDISTQSTYENIRVKRSPISFVQFIKTHPFFCILALVVSLCIPGLICGGEPGFFFFWLFVFDLLCWGVLILRFICYNEGKITKRLKISETLVISAISGNSIGITIFSDEWLSLDLRKDKNFGRDHVDQIFQAIRKMIEEKKVEADA